ncbi:SDR family oxidoreductase, partial [bacterium]|nr:SDR family oxidoreductase [bacterium]
AGFLSYHLCYRLIKEGHRVISMKNLITGTLNNITHLMKNKNFKFIKQDVTEYIKIDGSLDYVLHFASPASPVDYQKYPIQTLKVGALGTHKTLGLAKAKKAKYLLASTSEVYGDPLVNPQREDYRGNVNTIGPRGMYDEAKRFAEAMAMAYHRYHGIDTRIARIFNVFGERMRKRDGRVVPTFITQALAHEPLTVFGDGSQTRSFCYISDMIEGIYKSMLFDIHEPINLGNPQEISILDFARKIIELTKSKSKIVYKPLPKDDPKVRRPDISKAKKLLDWRPKVSLEEGLKKTIAWFRKSKEEQ